jgi:hypothetical protein
VWRPRDAGTARSHSNFKQREDMRSHSRGAMRPRFASTHPPSKREGAGKAGCRLHPRSCARKAHEWTTGSTGSLRLSLREWFTAYFALSPVTGLFATVALRIDDPSRTRLGRMHSARLDASIGASGPHDFAVRDRFTQKSCRTSCLRRVLAKTVCSVVRPRAVRSFTGRPALRSIARPTLSRPSHPTARS